MSVHQRKLKPTVNRTGPNNLAISTLKHSILTGHTSKSTTRDQIYNTSQSENIILQDIQVLNHSVSYN